jgi:hypothetical protein
MPKSKHFSTWLGWMGAVTAVGILLGTSEPVGAPFIGLINAIVYSAWADLDFDCWRVYVEK